MTVIKDIPDEPVRGQCQHLIKPVRRQGEHLKHLNIITACAAIGPTIRLDQETNQAAQEASLLTAAATAKDINCQRPTAPAGPTT